MSLSKRLINTGGAGGITTTFDFIVTNGEGTAGVVRSLDVTDPTNTSVVSTNTQNKYSYITGHTPAIYSTTGSLDRMIVSGTGGYFVFPIDINTGVLSNAVNFAAWRTSSNVVQQDVSYLSFSPTLDAVVRHRDTTSGWYNTWDGLNINQPSGSLTNSGARLGTNYTNLGNSFVDNINDILFVQNDNTSLISRYSPPTGKSIHLLPSTSPSNSFSSRCIEADPLKKVAYVTYNDNNVARVTSYDYTDNTISMVVLQDFIFPLNSNPKYMRLDSLNQVLYVIQDGTQITAVDVSDSSNMSYLGSFTDATNLVGANDILIDNVKKVAYVKTTTTAKLLSLNISNPSNITLISSINAGSASKITPIMPYILP